MIIARGMMAVTALIVSALLAACGLRCTSPSTETFTVYQDAPKMSPLDLGPPGNSPGDMYYFSAPLHSNPGGPVIGEVFGSKTLIKTATDANQNLEQRATLLIFDFGNRQDQIVVMAFAIIHRTPLNLTPARLTCAQYSAGLVSIWARVGS